MRLSYLQDFIVFARYMNITRAAMELHMTQSNLSKRIKQLEAEVGCELISHGERITLTPAGLIFLEQSTELLADYAKMLDKIRSANESELVSLRIRTPTWPDAAAAATIKLANQFRKLYPNTSPQFVLRQYERPTEMLDADEVDAHIIYEFESAERRMEEYEELGYFAFPICEDRLAIWISENHELAANDAVDVEELQSISIMQITQLYRPLEKAITDMCADSGFKPTLTDRTMNSFQEMLTIQSDDAVHLFPYSLKNDIQLTSCDGQRLMPIGKTKNVTAFLLMKAETDNTTVELFRSFLKTKLVEGC